MHIINIGQPTPYVVGIIYCLQRLGLGAPYFFGFNLSQQVIGGNGVVLVILTPKTLNETACLSPNSD